MTMLFTRVAAPAWVIILGLGVFFAPAGMMTTVMLIALGLVCTRVLITTAIWQRSLDEPAAEIMRVWPSMRHQPETIDAEFVSEDVTPTNERRAQP